MSSIVIMGVAGCGKSSLAALVAQSLGLPLIEGDDHHSPANREKMRQGIALTDDDRRGWLDSLCTLLRSHPQGAILTCSALKQSYRERLRLATPALRFVFLQIDPAEAQARVSARASSHFFSTTLVQSQFATLEDPTGEPGVLAIDARLPLAELQQMTTRWLPTLETPCLTTHL